MIYECDEKWSSILPAVWVHSRERLTEYFDGIKSKGVCACCEKGNMRLTKLLASKRISNSPVNRWNIIRPHVIKIGFTRRVFLSTDLTFETIDLKEYFIGSPLWLSDDKLLFIFILLSILNLDVRMFDRMVSSSSSTFLSEPRNHWSELQKREGNIRVRD